MKIEMKEAFDKYFDRLNKSYKAAFNTRPRTCLPNDVDIDKRLIVSEEDEDGYVEWAPVKIEKRPSLLNIEKELGFSLSAELKDFYLTYLFGKLEGTVGDIDLYFYKMYSINNLEKKIKQEYADGQWCFPNSQVFLIGDACCGGIDNFFIYYDNEKQQLFIYDNEEGCEQRIDIKTSIAETIANMKPFFEKDLEHVNE